MKLTKQTWYAWIAITIVFILLVIAFTSCQKTGSAGKDGEGIVMIGDDQLFGNGTERKPASPPGKNKLRPPRDTTIVNPPDTTTDPPDPPYNPSDSTAFVMLADFDGHHVTGQYWVNAYSAPADPELDRNEVLSLFRYIYALYNINITTSEAEFQAANIYRRQRLVFTSTDNYGTQGGSGVAYVGSGFWGPEVGQTESPVAFVYTTNLWNNEFYAATIGAHEAGHTLGLVHVHWWDVACQVTQTYRMGFVMGNPTQGVYAWHGGDPCRYQGGGAGKSDDQVLTEGVGRR